MTQRNENTLPSPRREGNIELLRIACMLLILGHHLAWHGMTMQSPLPENRVISTFLFSGGMTGVNCFVMITGYFLASFKAKRFAATLLQTLFYSVGLTLVMKYTGLYPSITGESIRDSALIITRSPYWFVTMYLGLNAVLPLLQPAVKNLGKHAHLWVLILSAAYLSVIPTFTFQNPSSPFFHQITWFFFLYALGAYFRKYPPRLMRWWPLHLLVFLGMITLMTGLCLWGNDHQELFQRVGSRQNYFTEKNAVPQLICSVALFLLFAGIRVKPFRVLTMLSGASFGVYLIHDHMFLRPLLWNQWFHVWLACMKPGFWKIVLLAPPIIYLSCALLDLVRKRLLEAPLMKRLNPVFEKIDGWINQSL